MPTATAEADIQALAEVLRPGLLRVSRHLRREASRAGVSVQDAIILGLVRGHPGIGVSELADKEQMSRPAMSMHVKRLAEAGWIAREAPGEDEDGRRVGLTLSPVGGKALDQIRRARNDWLAGKLAALSPEERAALAAAAGALKALAGDKAP